ncbi:MAG: hypothetical protein JSV68_04735, partial [Anaerolineaceae bacterium]
MLKGQFLGQFLVTVDSYTVEISSRPAQALFAYLMLNAGVPQRRERLSDLFWPKSKVENARNNLRHALWRIRKALNEYPACSKEIILADDFTICFDANADYWLDTAILDNQTKEITTEKLLQSVSVYLGELLPGFYDKWVILERERLQAVFDRKMGLLMQYMVLEQRWQGVLEQGERWIALGQAPEKAYCALMVAHSALGNSSYVTRVYKRCYEDMQKELDVKPSPRTTLLYDRLLKDVISQRELPQLLEGGLQEDHLLGGSSINLVVPEARTGSIKIKAGRRKVGQETTLGGWQKTSPNAAGQENSNLQKVLGIGKKRLRWVAGMSLLFLMMIIAVFFAFQQNALYRQQTRHSRARELAAVAINQLENDPELGLLLALAAVSTTIDVNEPALPEAESAVRQALQSMRVTLTVPGTGGVAFSPDGRSIATTDLDHGVKIWNAVTGEELISLVGHDDVVLNVSFSPDGGHLITTSLDGKAIVWDLYPGQEQLFLVGHEAGVISAAFSKDGSRIVTTSYDGTAKIWNADTAEELMTLSHTGITTGAEFSPDGSRVVVADHDAFTVQVWDTSSGERIFALEEHTEGVNDVAFSPDGERLVTTSNDATAKVWDAATGGLLFTLFHSSAVFDVDYSFDGSQLATASQDGTLTIWDADTGREIMKLPGQATGTTNIAFSRDGKHLVSGGAESKVWDITPGGGSEFQTIDGHDDLVFGLAYDIEGQRLASSSWDGTVKVWELCSGLLLKTMDEHEGRVASVTFSPDGNRLASAGYDGTVRIWDTASGEEMTRLIPTTAQNRIADSSQSIDKQASFDIPWTLGVAYSPDGRQLTSTSRDGTVKIWDASTGMELQSLIGHIGSVFGVAYSSDGRCVATSGEDGTARIWDSKSGKELLRLDGHTNWVTSVHFSPDGQLLATSSFDKTVRLWDTITGEEILSLSGSSAFWDVTFSADGSYLFTNGFDGTVRQWDATTGEELFTLY